MTPCVIQGKTGTLIPYGSSHQRSSRRLRRRQSRARHRHEALPYADIAGSSSVPCRRRAPNSWGRARRCSRTSASPPGSRGTDLRDGPAARPGRHPSTLRGPIGMTAVLVEPPPRSLRRSLVAGSGKPQARRRPPGAAASCSCSRCSVPRFDRALSPVERRRRGAGRRAGLSRTIQALRGRGRPLAASRRGVRRAGAGPARGEADDSVQRVGAPTTSRWAGLRRILRRRRRSRGRGGPATPRDPRGRSSPWRSPQIWRGDPRTSARSRPMINPPRRGSISSCSPPPARSPLAALDYRVNAPLARAPWGSACW